MDRPERGRVLGAAFRLRHHLLRAGRSAGQLALQPRRGVLHDPRQHPWPAGQFADPLVEIGCVGVAGACQGGVGQGADRLSGDGGQLLDSQQVVLSVAGKDKAGTPGRDRRRARMDVSDPAVAGLVDNGDGTQALVTTGVLGSIVATVTDDADVYGTPTSSARSLWTSSRAR